MSEQVRQVALCHQLFRRSGGMEHYAIGLARALKELGCEVTVYAREVDSELAAEIGVTVALSPQRAFLRKFRDWQFQRFVEASLPKMQGLQIGLSRVRVAHLSICGGTHIGYLRATRRLPGPFDGIYISLERRAYAAARIVVSHSDLCTGELAAFYGVAPAKVQTLYPPVEPQFSPGDWQESRRALGLPLDKPILLFASMGHRRKGFDQICRALAGFGGEAPILAVAGKPVNANRWPFVVSLGYIDNMVTAYRAADFTVLGSSYEPFGLVGPESVLSGTRLLFEENIGCLTSIDRDVATIFRAGDKASVRTALVEVLELYKSGNHRLAKPAVHLRYNADPVEHARALLHLGRFCGPGLR